MRRLILSVLLALLALPATAHAGFFGGEVIDGPNPDLVEVGDLDIARDGQGGVVYIRREGGVPHVFFSRFQDGAFLGPERVDDGLAGAASSAVIGASDNNRLAIAWVTDGSVYAAVKGKDAPGFSAPALVAQGASSRPSIDVSINGATYLAWSQGGDVRVARAERDSAAFNVIPTAMDVTPGTSAGETARKAPQIDVSADGTALVVWGEEATDGRTHVIARRLFELRPSTAPQDLNVPEVGGAPAASADTPRLDMEDDSSYAQVVFRQNTTSGPRLIMRRLVGSSFDPPLVLDSGIPADSGSVDLTGRGEGLFAGSGAGGETIAGTIFNNKISGQTRLNDPNGVLPLADPAIGENEDGAVTWMQGTGDNATIASRYFEGIEFVKLADAATLSNPAFGPVHVQGGLKADASRAGDVVAVFMQGGTADRRLVAGGYDKPPTRIAPANSQRIRKLTRLAWGNSLNLFGGTKYTILVDGKAIGESTTNSFTPPPGAIPDGNHRWQIQISDRRGQTVVSRTRRLRVDNTPPLISVNMRKRGRVLSVSVKGRDSRGRLKSGYSRTVVDWGDGKLVRLGRSGSKRYSRGGRFRVRVKGLDKAGNEVVETRRVSIGR
jgi:hypothetical protein